MTLDEFAATPDGAIFFDTYDALVERSSARVRELESRWGVTRVNSYGPESAAPMVLLPGGGATSLSYAGIVAVLAQHRLVHTVDIIGDAGRSVAADRGPRTTDDLIDWLADVLDALDARPVDLVGHSYGAMIALAYALRAPVGRIRRLILLDPTSCFAGLRLPYLLHAAPVLVAPSPRRQERLLRWETRSAELDAPWVEMYCAGARFPTGRTVVPKRPTRRMLSRLDGPETSTTVILAPHSRAHDSMRVAEAVTRLLPTARVRILESGSHHTLPHEPAGEIVDALLSVQD